MLMNLHIGEMCGGFCFRCRREKKLHKKTLGPADRSADPNASKTRDFKEKS